jgi:hypothetical protein
MLTALAGLAAAPWMPKGDIYWSDYRGNIRYYRPEVSPLMALARQSQQDRHRRWLAGGPWRPRQFEWILAN